MSSYLFEPPAGGLKSCRAFNKFPDNSHLPNREVFVLQCAPSRMMASMNDIQLTKYEDHQRSNRPCLDPKPAAFDPERLEAVRQAQVKPYARNYTATRANAELISDDDGSQDPYTYVQLSENERIANGIYSNQANGSSESVHTEMSIVSSLDTDDGLERYEAEATVMVASAQTVNRVKCCAREMVRPVESKPKPTSTPTPRIKASSRPPLSRSAFAHTGSPSSKDNTQWGRPSLSLADYPRAPNYFPYQNRSRKKKQSDKQ